MTATDWETIPVDDVPRDTWGRPKIMAPGGGKLTAYTRTTTLANTMEDTLNLGKWQQRMVAVGLASRPDLLLRASSLGPEPPKLVVAPDGVTWTTNPRRRPWSDDMDSTCESAQEAARAHAKATVGTALHALTQAMDVDTGEVPIVPQEYLPHLAAYGAATDGWTWLAVERFVVLDDIQVAGTPDRIAIVPGLERPVIADLKTGDVEYGLGKIAIQLACYSRARFYDHRTGQREPLPEVDQDLGLVVALDATTGRCEVHQVDLQAGWEGAQLALEVRAWRRKRGLLKPWQPRGATNGQAPIPMDTPVVPTLLEAVRTAETNEVLTELWKSHRADWTPELTAAAKIRKADLAGGGGDGPRF